VVQYPESSIVLLTEMFILSIGCEPGKGWEIV